MTGRLSDGLANKRATGPMLSSCSDAQVIKGGGGWRYEVLSTECG